MNGKARSSPTRLRAFFAKGGSGGAMVCMDRLVQCDDLRNKVAAFWRSGDADFAGFSRYRRFRLGSSIIDSLRCRDGVAERLCGSSRVRLCSRRVRPRVIGRLLNRLLRGRMDPDTELLCLTIRLSVLNSRMRMPVMPRRLSVIIDPTMRPDANIATVRHELSHVVATRPQFNPVRVTSRPVQPLYIAYDRWPTCVQRSDSGVQLSRPGRIVCRQTASFRLPMAWLRIAFERSIHPLRSVIPELT